MKKIVCRIFLSDRQLLFNLLVYNYRTHSSNIPSGRRSESNPIAQWVIVDKVVQFRLLRHGHIQCILNPGTVNGNFSPIEYKKSEPFSYWKKVRILLLWCTSRDSNPGPTD